MFNSSPSLADIAAVTDNNRNNNGGFGDGNGWWVLIILFALFGGWGNNRYGSNGDCQSSGGSMPTSFANIERKIDGVNTGLCDGFYAMNTGMLNGFAGIQNSMNQGFTGLNTALVAQGYESRLATQNLSSQMAECCCSEKELALANANALQRQISDCCCDIERQNMQSRFDAQQYNCATLQAIDKVGDRIIDYLAQEKNQALRDENFQLRLSASKCEQNAYLIDALRPSPRPTFTVPNPYCGCGSPYGYGNYNNYGGNSCCSNSCCA